MKRPAQQDHDELESCTRGFMEAFEKLRRHASLVTIMELVYGARNAAVTRGQLSWEPVPASAAFYCRQRLDNQTNWFLLNSPVLGTKQQHVFVAKFSAVKPLEDVRFVTRVAELECGSSATYPSPLGTLRVTFSASGSASQKVIMNCPAIVKTNAKSGKIESSFVILKTDDGLYNIAFRAEFLSWDNSQSNVAPKAYDVTLDVDNRPLAVYSFQLIARPEGRKITKHEKFLFENQSLMARRLPEWKVEQHTDTDLEVTDRVEQQTSLAASSAGPDVVRQHFVVPPKDLKYEGPPLERDSNDDELDDEHGDQDELDHLPGIAVESIEPNIKDQLSDILEEETRERDKRNTFVFDNVYASSSDDAE